MKKLQKLGRVLTKLEQSTINGGIHKCGTLCEKEHAGRKCCVECAGTNFKWCPIRIPTWGVNDDVPTIV